VGSRSTTSPGHRCPEGSGYRIWPLQGCPVVGRVLSLVRRLVTRRVVG
jgi:hypothetical protein